MNYFIEKFLYICAFVKDHLEIKRYLKYLIVICSLTLLPISQNYASPPAPPLPSQSSSSSNNATNGAGDALDTIIDILSGLTCETQGIGDLLRSEFSHTCIPAPFFTFAMMNLVSPVLYMNTFMRLKINDHDIFDDKFPGGQCTRQNRIEGSDKSDPNYMRLNFALCNNVQLAVSRATAVAESAIAIATAVLTGKDPWPDIAKAWTNKKKDYHIQYDGKPGDDGLMMDVGFPITYWKIIQDNDRVCVATPGFTGYVPVGCKYIKEPFPESIYSSFMNLSANSSPPAATDPLALVDCALGSEGGCYRRAYNNSKTAIVITAPLIECMKEMTARLLISRDVCTFDNVNEIMDAGKKNTSSLFQFQKNMHKFVTALLTLYVMFFGAKMIMAGNVLPRSEIINFILKMIFVTYFSIGLNINPSNSGNNERLDGMTQFAFPFLLNGINGLANWVMNASPSDLCKFNGTNIKYEPSMAYIALWDALDCRVSHYLGLDMLSTLMVENSSRNHDFKNFDFFSFSAPPYIYLLIPAIISGNMTLVSLALAYPLLVISVAAFMVNATVMCMISIVILGILAPLFVPMLLFEYTKEYFKSWVKLLISFLLQPMVVATFMITMFSVYDFGFYGHCKYASKLISNSVENAIQDGAGSSRDVLIFYVDNDWNGGKYDGGEDGDDAKSCKNSLGYMLNNPISSAFDFGKSTVSAIVGEDNKPGSKSTAEFLLKFAFLGGVVTNPGMVFTSVKLIFEKVKDVLLALITACFTLYLMYNFSSMLAEFAADMTEGVALSNVAINPQAIFKAGMAAVAAAGQAAGAADKALSGGGRGSDKLLSGGGGSSDQLSSGGGGASDKFLSGGGGASDMLSSGGGDSGPSSGGGGLPLSSGRSPASGLENNDVAAPITSPRENLSQIDTPIIEAPKTSPVLKMQEKPQRIKISTEEEKVEILPDTMEVTRRIETIEQEDLSKKIDGVNELKSSENILGGAPKKAYGLSDYNANFGVESHELQQGQIGYIKQEKRNAEIKEKRAATKKEREELLKSGGGRATPSDEKDGGSSENK